MGHGSHASLMATSTLKLTRSLTMLVVQGLADTCWNFGLSRTYSPQSNTTQIVMNVNSTLTDSCSVQIGQLAQPLYMRLPLSVQGLSLMASSTPNARRQLLASSTSGAGGQLPGSFTPNAGGQLAPTDKDGAVIPNVAGGLTWSFVPAWANNFVFTMQVSRTLCFCLGSSCPANCAQAEKILAGAVHLIIK